MKTIGKHQLNLVISLFCILAWLLPVSLCIGQDITTVPPGVENVPYQFFVENGGIASLQFVMEPTTGGTWEILPDDDTHPNNLPIGCSINPTTGSFNCQLPYEISPDALQYNFTVQFNFENGNPSHSEPFTLKVKRPGAHVMLVLDKSGSMNQKVSSSSIETKWDVLKSSVSNFLMAYRKWEVSSSNNAITGGLSLVKDKIGVTYYSHQRSDYNPVGLNIYNPPPLIPADDHQTKIIAQMPSLPGGATCLGGGVIAAYKAFNFSETQLKHIIVFSDGLQNTNPKFNSTENKIYRFGTEPDGFLFNEVLDFNSTELPKFKIHTICIGDIMDINLMNALSEAHTIYKGKHIGITSPENFYFDLNNGFLDLFEEMLANFSPQKINRNVSILKNGKAEESFIINKTVDRIFIQTVGSASDLKDVKAEVKNGDKILPPNFITYSKTCISFFIGINSLDSLDINPDGTWTISFSGRDGSKLSTTCIVNDEYIDYECSVDQLNYLPGQPITCKLKVWADGKPVSHLDKAMVYIHKPGEDVNDLFSNTPIPVNIPSKWPSEPGNFAGQDKYEKLIALDSSFVNRLKQVIDSMPMGNIGNNTFATIFPNTKESGLYKFIFRFTGHDDKTGTYERYYMLNKLIDFGTADITKSKFNFKWAWFKSRLELKLVNQYGHLMGPNRLANISITLNGQKLKLIDNLDGTYSAKLPCFLLFKKKKEVIVEVKGKILFKIKLGDVSRKQK
jgi:hypothetical protein